MCEDHYPIFFRKLFIVRSNFYKSHDEKSNHKFKNISNTVPDAFINNHVRIAWCLAQSSMVGKQPSEARQQPSKQDMHS